MKKQTAVDWLVEQITDGTIPVREAIEQAKAMELHQMEFFFKQGHLNSGCPYALEEVYLKKFPNESND